MKLFISALFAALALAQDATTTTTTEPAPAEETKETEPIVTTLSWTDGLVDMNDSQISLLTDRTNPKAPTEPLGVSGTLSVMTDADGANWLTADLTGYWAAKWQATGTYNSYRGYLGFIIIDDYTTEEVAADGTVSTSTGQYKELITFGGNSVQNSVMQPEFAQWDMSKVTNWDYSMSHAEYFNKYAAEAGSPVTVWTVEESSVIDNGANSW